MTILQFVSRLRIQFVRRLRMEDATLHHIQTFNFETCINRKHSLVMDIKYLVS